MAGLFKSVTFFLRSTKQLLRRGSQLRQKELFQAAYDVYHRAAERGSTEAMLALARMHEAGEGTPVSLPHALYWYEQAARLDDVEGLFGAGSCLMRLERVPRGLRNWYRSASHKEPERAAELGTLLGAQIEIEDPYGRARDYLTAACAKGHAEAHYQLAELLVRGLGGVVDARQAHDLYVVAAAQGNAGAEYGLAELYRTGNGCMGDSETALAWYRRAAAKGHVPAQLMVAQELLASGERDAIKEARDWLEQAAGRNAPHAEFLLAKIELSVEEKDRNIEAAKQHVRRAAARGHVHAMKLLARIYEEGLLGEAPDAIQAALLYKKVAETGDAEAQFIVGRMYARGEGLPANMASAARWFARSAEAGHPLAQYNFALHLESGAGVNPDPARARLMVESAASLQLAPAQFKLGRDLLRSDPQSSEGVEWLKRAAEQNHLGALDLLGRLYARGEFGQKDTSTAREYLLRAAEGGHVASYVQLAALLHEDDGSIDASVDLLERAASQGSAEAEFALANLFLKGKAANLDKRKGLAWLKAAADHGHATALFELAVCYCRGDGVEADIERGVELYRAAGEQGHVIGKYNFATMVLGGRCGGGDVDLARRFIREAALAGLQEAVSACATYDVEVLSYEDEPVLTDVAADASANVSPAAQGPAA